MEKVLNWKNGLGNVMIQIMLKTAYVQDVMSRESFYGGIMPSITKVLMWWTRNDRDT